MTADCQEKDLFLGKIFAMCHSDGSFRASALTEHWKKWYTDNIGNGKTNLTFPINMMKGVPHIRVSLRAPCGSASSKR